MRDAWAMVILKTMGLLLLILLLLWGGLMLFLSLRATPPETGLVAGELRPCPPTPNCVSSESRVAASRIAPLRFSGSAEQAWHDLRWALGRAGGTIVAERDGYLWATFTSRLFRFVDDVECRMVAEEGVIHLRSASRVGRSDLGVNAARVAQLRQLFQQRQYGAASQRL